MKINTTLLIIFFFCTVSRIAIAQAIDDRGYFMVEAEKFTPPVKELIATFEGHVAEGFLASDIYGKEHFLNDYRGKTTFLFFWNLESDIGRQLCEDIKSFHSENGNHLNVIGMAINQKQSLLDFFENNQPPFPIIPNGEVFGQMAYGADLGSPRIFAINSSGIITRVIPKSIFTPELNIAKVLQETLDKSRN